MADACCLLEALRDVWVRGPGSVNIDECDKVKSKRARVARSTSHNYAHINEGTTGRTGRSWSVCTKWQVQILQIADVLLPSVRGVTVSQWRSCGRARAFVRVMATLVVPVVPAWITDIILLDDDIKCGNSWRSSCSRMPLLRKFAKRGPPLPTGGPGASTSVRGALSIIM